MRWCASRSDHTVSFPVLCLLWMIFHVSRTNGFVRFLCSLRLCFEVARMYIAFAHHLYDSVFAAGCCIFRQVDGVRTHISDKSGFVQTLCDHHRLCYGISQFACRFLLQGRSCKRSRRRFLYRTVVISSIVKVAPLHASRNAFASSFVLIRRDSSAFISTSLPSVSGTRNMAITRYAASV